jgi:hypothetical protein
MREEEERGSRRREVEWLVSDECGCESGEREKILEISVTDKGAERRAKWESQKAWSEEGAANIA